MQAVKKNLKQTVSIAFLASSLGLAFNCFAAKTLEDCQKVESTIEEHSKCLDNVKSYVDRQLQAWVNNQTFELEEVAKSSGRHSPLNLFKRSQKNFITYRDTNCKWQYLASPPTESASIHKMCYILLTQNRINELSMPTITEINKKRHY